MVLRSGATVLGRVNFQPDLSQSYLARSLPLDGASGNISSSSTPGLYPGQTNLLVIRVTRPNSNSFAVEAWINPPAAYPGSGTIQTTKSSISIPTLMDNIGLRVASTDTGGPTSSLIVDELRMGYAWTDVVPPGPAPALVPDLAIEAAVKLKWQTQTGKTYQPQYSFDLTTWFNLGSAVVGNGTIKELFDSTEAEAKKFYRVQVP